MVAAVAEVQKIVDGSLEGKKKRDKYIKKKLNEKNVERIVDPEEFDCIFNDTLVIDKGMI